MREDRQLYTILGIINGYSNKEPLNRYLKNYFNAHREMGSRDRRQAADFIYNYYRIGKAIAGKNQEERITVGNYLCADSSFPLLEYCVSKFLAGIATEPVPSIRDSKINLERRIDRIKYIYPDFKTEDIFSYSQHLSSDIKKDQFLFSLLKQPKLWIRVRKNFIEEVKDELTIENISFEMNDEHTQTFSFASATKLDKLKSYEEDILKYRIGHRSKRLIISNLSQMNSGGMHVRVREERVYCFVMQSPLFI